MTVSKPVLVLVPGAWHPSSCYSALISQLRSAGYEVHSFDNSSLNCEDPFTATCEADALALRQHILPLINKGQDLVLVCHSYGGTVGSGAAYGLSKKARSEKGEKGGVIGLMYISSHIIPEGVSVAEPAGGKYPPFVVEDKPSKGFLTTRDELDFFYADVEKDAAEQLVRQLGTQSRLSLESPVPKQAWAEEDFAGRLAYIRCIDDKGFPFEVQEMFISRSGVHWVTRDMQTSHSPFASQPKETADIVLELTEGFVNHEA